MKFRDEIVLKCINEIAQSKMERIVRIVLFIFGSIVLIGLVPIFCSGPYSRVFVLPQLFITLYFFKEKSPLFRPSLFLSLLILTFFIPLIPSVWLLNLIIAISIYLIISFSFSSMKRETSWFKFGHIDKAVLLGILLIIIVSSFVLIIWNEIFKPDINNYMKMIPDVNIGLIILGIIGFAVFNGIAEEVMFRGIYWDGLERLFNSITVIIFLQALFFGLCHYNGFPKGIVGIMLSFIYGVFLGIVRYRSQGLLAPISAHIFADIIISVIVLRTIGKI